MNQRYKVDERIHCAAIVDTFYPECGPGLDPDQHNVCEWAWWKDDDEKKIQLTVLHAKCSRYNEEDPTTRERVMELRNRLTNVVLELEEVFAFNKNYDKRNLRDLLC